MSYKRISFETKENIAYVGMGYNCTKAMTVLDEETLNELQDIVEELHGNASSLKGVIFHSHKDRCFIAGADINLISSMKTEADGQAGSEAGQKIFNRIEDLKVTTVACVGGVCLGGGLELALSCNKIITSDDKGVQLGLPEVKLGIIPGFGGTYRLPKKVGLPTALDMILSGKTLDGRKGKKVGLVEETYAKERLLDMALKHLGKTEKKKSFKESLEDLATDNVLTKKIIFQKARESVLKKTKGFYQAPLKILDVMEAGVMKGRASYLASEAEAFGELCVGDQSKNLQHIFFMVESSKKYPGIKGEGKIKKLERGACLGAGTMGGGIAWLMAKNDMKPIMKDLNQTGLELGLKQSASNFMGAVKRKRMSYDDFERMQRSIIAQTDFRGFGHVDLVIEAVVENMDIKKKVFAEVETKVSKDTILTSNTSSLSIQEMSTALEDSSRFAGLHFFNPVHMMPLVEIITHDNVSPETVEALYNWVLKTKKTPVVVKDGPGFLVNRILMPFMNEAGFLLEEGVSMKDIDDACLNFGMPMGPCRLLDEVGIDVGQKVAKIIHDGLGDRAASSSLTGKLVEKGFLGRKTSKGFYLYDENGKVAGPNAEALAIFPKATKKMTEVEIQKRIFLPMINEAATVLEDKIVDNAMAVDLGLIFGIGFPPFRGGLLKYADSEGLERIQAELVSHAESVDKARYTPCKLINDLVSQKKKFYEL
ncbi:3-hydroxyacyl-CoA dehydrogenase NAD-binding domain-containing protein [Bacteriovorax sp. Seq25_V]|uniref:3-hydroxyacyl-CoA dehydrogenase NAD-binding domain-containing protein n=1 Tax=Bacteriovorax sp. Seq25_V TaxID=1201288 RepID=UPI000389DFC6|nr:3-hydroxyacyl-CoA dehydrogenase NAD-binding domain-containing protein [Bacteriovorax sp. Seq25_V]EQC44254.1 enoyl-CoA hydratase/isomerase family protein [Bacteriovorax sp. Seq25_V]